MAPARVQVIALNVPVTAAVPLLLVKPTVPVGVVAPVEDMSVTLAVQVTVWPTRTVEGQLTAVVVGWRFEPVTATMAVL